MSSVKADIRGNATVDTASPKHGTRLAPYMDILTNIADALVGIDTDLTPLERMAVSAIEYELAEQMLDEPCCPPGEWSPGA